MIKAKVKNAPVWSLYQNCSLGISLQSQNHVGEYLRAIVTWTNGKFENCLIDLSDTLHRYNYMIEENLSAGEAYKKARREGDLWLEKNRHIIDDLAMPFRILRWDEWLDHPELESCKHSFWAAYNDDAEFNKAVLADVQNYYMRRHGLLLEDVPEKNILLSAAYLLEELAVHSLFFKNYRSTTIYPGRQQACFKLVREGKVPNVPTGLQNSSFIGLFLHRIAEDKAHQSGETNLAA